MPATVKRELTKAEELRRQTVNAFRAYVRKNYELHDEGTPGEHYYGDVPLHFLEPAWYNPKGRTDDSKTSYQFLKTMMAQRGYLHQAILVNWEANTIEGNRRMTIAKDLKWSHVKCKVYTQVTEEESYAIYAECNSTQEKHRPNDQLYAFVQHPLLVTPSIRVKMLRMERRIERGMVVELCNMGGSLATYEQACRVAKFCNARNDMAFIVESLKWLLNTRQTLEARWFMKNERSSGVRLRDLVKNNGRIDVLPKKVFVSNPVNAK